LSRRSPSAHSCPRLCENAQEPARRRIVFSITLLPIAVTALFVFRLTKSRRTFYAQIECLCFHTVWPPSGRCRRHRAVAMSDGKQTFVERLPSEGNASGAACNKARPNRCSIRPTAQLTPIASSRAHRPVPRSSTMTSSGTPQEMRFRDSSLPAYRAAIYSFHLAK
jgi:hypothetical protein